MSLPIRNTIDNYLIRLRTQSEHYTKKNVIEEVLRKICPKYFENIPSDDIVGITKIYESFLSTTEYS